MVSSLKWGLGDVSNNNFVYKVGQPYLQSNAMLPILHDSYFHIVLDTNGPHEYFFGFFVQVRSCLTARLALLVLHINIGPFLHQSLQGQEGLRLYGKM